MGAAVENRGVFVKGVLCPISMMNIPVKNENFVQLLNLLGVASDYSDIVE